MRTLADIVGDQRLEQEEEEDLRSRSDDRRENREEEMRLERIAKQLITLSDKRMKKMQLPDRMLTEVRLARSIKSIPARTRQLRVVRRTLRDSEDSHEIDARLQELLNPDGRPDRRALAAQRWADRLVAEGDAAMNQLVDGSDAPDVRRRLSQLRRNLEKATPERQKRARKSLVQAVAALLDDAGQLRSAGH
jgi:ribosome-associated protein